MRGRWREVQDGGARGGKRGGREGGGAALISVDVAFLIKGETEKDEGHN